MAWIDRCRDGDRVRLINSAERACRLDGAAEQRFAGAAGVDIIEVKVQLRDDAVAAAWAIDRDQPSMSNWKVLPTQIMLGLMVPLLTLPDVKCSPRTFAGWPPPAKSGD